MTIPKAAKPKQDKQADQIINQNYKKNTIGPFFTPKAKPAPQPAIAFVQIAFVPTILSVTHSKAV